jgi:hypothetical protein
MASANVVQTSVSGGIQNALALQGDGVFFPKVSTASRLALTLGTSDAGFTVYDSQVGNLYFWTGTAWQSVPNSGSPGLNGQVQYNNNGTVQGATGFTFDNATNAVSMGGDLTVRTTGLKVTSSAVGIGTASPIAGSKLHVDGGFIYGTNTAGAGLILFRTTDPTTQAASPYIKTPVTSGYSADAVYGFWYQNCGISNPAFEALAITTNSSERYRIASDGVATWSNVGGVAGTAMTLNATGLGVGASPSYKLEVVAPAGDNIVSLFRSGDATAANNAGGGFRSISSATAASRVAQIWLDADGADFSSGDYFFIQKNGNSGTVEFNQYSNAAMTFMTNATERARIDASGNLILQSSATPATLGTNGMLTVNATSNTNLRFSYRGSDGTTRVANITLA